VVLSVDSIVTTTIGGDNSSSKALDFVNGPLECFAVPEVLRTHDSDPNDFASEAQFIRRLRSRSWCRCGRLGSSASGSTPNKYHARGSYQRAEGQSLFQHWWSFLSFYFVRSPCAQLFTAVTVVQ
jgi:hypothetical protein